MRAWITGLPVIAVVLASAVGCAGQPGPAERTPVEPLPASEPAGRITVRVSGGIQGTVETYDLVRRNPPPGSTSAEIDKVFALADSRALQALDRQRSRRWAPTCCDIQTYDVMIRHRDGSRTHVVVTGMAPKASPLNELIRRVTRAVQPGR